MPRLPIDQRRGLQTRRLTARDDGPRCIGRVPLRVPIARDHDQGSGIVLDRDPRLGLPLRMIGPAVLVHGPQVRRPRRRQKRLHEAAIGHERQRLPPEREGRPRSFRLDRLQAPALPDDIGRRIGHDRVDPRIAARRDQRELRTLGGAQQPEPLHVRLRHRGQCIPQIGQLVDPDVHETSRDLGQRLRRPVLAPVRRIVRQADRRIAQPRQDRPVSVTRLRPALGSMQDHHHRQPLGPLRRIQIGVRKARHRGHTDPRFLRQDRPRSKRQHDGEQGDGSPDQIRHCRLQARAAL